ncbi:MAG: acetolactate synthase AlsS [Acuticoccus sp.]
MLPDNSGAALLVDCLERHGVDHVFAIPGAKIDPVFEVLAARGKRITVCRHEQNAAFICGAIGRITQQPGVCIVTSGPGVSNLATGLLTATTEGDPMVALGGAVPRAQRLKRTHQSMDSVALLSSVTRYCAEVEVAEAMPEIVATAFRAARTPRGGASFVSLPQDVLAAPTDQAAIEPLHAPLRGPAAPAAIEEVARLLEGAALPAIIVGHRGGAPAAAMALRRLLRKTPMAVVGTFEGAGAISRDLLDCWVGRVGLFQNQPGDKLLQAADVVVTIGFDPIEYDPWIWNTGSARLVHIDARECDIDTAYRPAVELIGDVPATLDGLAEVLGNVNGPREVKLIGDLRRELSAILATVPQPRAGRIHPTQFMREMRELIGDDVTVCCDIGSHYIWMARNFFVHEPRRLLFSNGQQTLGVALPWAIGATVARPGEKAISLSGDGGFLFSAMELETAVRMQADIVHIVWRDGSYDMVRIQQLMKYGREAGVRFNTPDLVTFAQSFGATGLRITAPEDIRPVLKRALETPGPVVVDVPIDYADNEALCQTVDAQRVN